MFDSEEETSVNNVFRELHEVKKIIEKQALKKPIYFSKGIIFLR